jgi:hypothetical protein
VAGLLTLIWRFIDFYLGLLVGGAAFILVMRDVGRTPRREFAETAREELPQAAEEEPPPREAV